MAMEFESKPFVQNSRMASLTHRCWKMAEEFNSCAGAMAGVSKVSPGEKHSGW